MAGTPKCLGQYKLTNASSTAFTVPANRRWTVSMIHVQNTDTVQHTVRLNHVLSGDSLDVKNRILPDVGLPSGDFVEFGGGMVLAVGDTVQGYADLTNVVGVTMYGIEEVV